LHFFLRNTVANSVFFLKKKKILQILSRVYSGAGLVLSGNMDGMWSKNKRIVAGSALRLAEGRLMTSCEFVAQGQCRGEREFFTTLANLLFQAAREKNRSTIANFSIPVSSR
jgi:hypothetical protein